MIYGVIVTKIYIIFRYLTFPLELYLYICDINLHNNVRLDYPDVGILNSAKYCMWNF